MTAVAHEYGTNRADHFDFSFDSDTVNVVYAYRGNDLISDGAADGYWSPDEFRGMRGDDTIVSTDGSDRLFGGVGNDRITVMANWFDPADTPFSTVTEHSTVGFDVSVCGGRGDDTLTITNSSGASVEQHGHEAIIHTRFGGTITAHGIEHLLLL